MELKQAYTLLKEVHKDCRLASNLRSKANLLKEIKRIENRVWEIFQQCPELYCYVPYEGEFFVTSNFRRDFDRLMEKLNEMNLN